MDGEINVLYEHTRTNGSLALGLSLGPKINELMYHGFCFATVTLVIDPEKGSIDGGSALEAGPGFLQWSLGNRSPTR